MSVASSFGFQFLASSPLRLMQSNRQAMRVGVLLSMVIILNAVDLAFTLFAHWGHMLSEVNPLANNFLRLNFTQGLICYKLVMVLSGSVMLWKLRASRWAGVGCWLLVVVYTGLAVVWCMWVKDAANAPELVALLAPMRHVVH